MLYTDQMAGNKHGANNTFASKAAEYFLNISDPPILPGGIEAMNPYHNLDVRKNVSEFLGKFFNDNNERILILGINPGRFGGGVTGISFTDPAALEKFCGIRNSMDKKSELSSKFIYSFISSYGGAEKFYSKFFISALYPLALIKNGKNFNYYDELKIWEYLKPYIAENLKIKISFGISDKSVICLGRKNYKFLKEINEENRFFNRIFVLNHPRYIMQYKNKLIQEYIGEYLKIMDQSIKA